MEYTTNYQLRKPIIGVDLADIKDENRNMDTIDEIMHASQVSLAEAYDRTKTYNTDDVVMYEFLMYKCLEDNVTGTWNASKWERTTASAHGAGGGSDVEITPTLQSGTKIADYKIDGVQGELYAPTGGGGGSSTLAGLSDVDLDTPLSGQALVYDGTNWVNGDAVGGSGMFINIDDVVYDGFVFDANEHTWIATQSCILGGYMDALSSSLSCYIDIDGIDVMISYETHYGIFIPVKMGQEVTYRGKSTSNMKAYGISYTSPNLQPVIYSTEEREVGVWIDGKTLYQQVFDLGNPLIVNNNNWTTTLIDKADIENIVNAFAISENGTYWNDISADKNISSYISLLSNRNGDTESVRWVGLYYTKTTDVAGSGSWTPSGVPAHHYSTDEQVVGTWIDGGAVYEKSFSGLSISLPSNTWVDSGCSIPGINKVIDIKAYANTASISAIGDPASDGVIRLMGMRNAPVTLEQFTIRYTKSTT